MARWIARLGLAAAAGACTEDLAAPGRCPDFCPGGQIAIVDTILAMAVVRDTAYRGFVESRGAPVLAAAELPAVSSRPFFLLPAATIPDRVAPVTTDTTTVPTTVDSARLTIAITHRDTAATNLTLGLYQVPLTIDSTTTYDSLSAFFAGSPVRNVNVSALLAQPSKRDPVTGDSITVDTMTHVLTVLVRLTTTQAPYVVADTGKLAYGIRVSADSLASVAIGAIEGGRGARLTWFYSFDSLGTAIRRTVPASASFDSYVFDPPPPPLDSTLVVGGAPAARSILRVDLPRRLRDSVDIVRATLVLVPATAAVGVPADSFLLAAHAVIADFGGKSPLYQATPLDSSRVAAVWVHTRSTDTVAVEVTRLFRSWSDSTAPTALMLRQDLDGGLQPLEGGSFAEIRFQPTRNAARRPTVHLTFVRRFPFGQP